jgi:NO-binding membrane sensor protein with MHYT domain
MMALAATLVTLYTAYVAYQFFTHSFPQLPTYYLWAIRLSLLIFVVFSFEGFAMGSRMSHSIGALNDNSNLWILGWSKTVGDLRVSHFIGMHALQVLPILSFYLIKNTKGTIAVAVLYGLLALVTLGQALQGKPFLRGSSTKTGIQN